MAYKPNLFRSNGSTVSATASFGGAPENAVNGTTGGVPWRTGTSGLPQSWAIDFGSGRSETITSLNIFPSNTGDNNFKDFTFYGSNLASPDISDDGDWTSIGSDQHADTFAFELFNFSNSTAYRHYRIKVTSEWGGTPQAGMQEIEAFDGVEYSDDGAVGGTASATSEDSVPFGADKAFDKNFTTEWSSDGSASPHIIAYDLGSGNEITVNLYRIFARDDNTATRAPKDFTFWGSNLASPSLTTDGDWTLLDTQTGHTYTLGEERFFHNFTQGQNNVPYRHYRLKSTDNNFVGDDYIQFSELLFHEFNITDELIAFNEIIEISDDFVISIDEVEFFDTIEISDNFIIKGTIEKITFNEIIEVDDNIVIDLKQATPFTTRIISFNPLFTITNTDPAKLSKIVIDDPLDPIISAVILPGAKFAKDIAINTTTEEIFVSCADGIIVKVDLNDINMQTIIDVSDLDDLETITVLSSFGIGYTGTSNNIGEIYVLDERSELILDSDFQLLTPIEFLMDSDFNAIEVFTMDSDFQALSEKTFLLECDFKCLTTSIDSITPLSQTDFHVFVDGTELQDTDLLLDSIIVQKTVEEKETAEFVLCRKHDDLNTTNTGSTVIINNKNSVRVDLGTTTIFTGKISQLNPSYAINTDQITVQATGVETDYRFDKINLSLAGVNERLSLYHILLQNYNIINEDISTTDENPTKFKGIRASLGTSTIQRVIRYHDSDPTGSIAKEINDGKFIPRNGRTYFWSPTATQFGDFKLGKVSSRFFNYIGTSLAPVTADLWLLTNAHHRLQKINSDVVRRLGSQTSPLTIGELGAVVSNPTTIFNELVSKKIINNSGIILYLPTKRISGLSADTCKSEEILALLSSIYGYSKGEAPFRTISTRNGILRTKFRWEDSTSSLLDVKDEGYNYTNFVKKVVDLEYQKLLNINGQIFPETSASIELTVDAFLYYNLKVLTRINIDNTTNAGIYKNNNGFPVAIKSLTINSESMKVAIQSDNIKSNKELEVIDDQYPCEEDGEYIDDGRIRYIATKSSMVILEDVEDWEFNPGSEFFENNTIGDVDF